MAKSAILCDMEEKRALVLMGIKHCGKSTQGRLLAEHFSCPLYDSDDVVAAATGLSPRELYTQRGESAFMEAEQAACEWIANQVGQTAMQERPSGVCAVVATGGGICKNGGALSALRGVGIFVFLNADEKTAADRIVREVGIAENGALINLPAYIAREQPRSIDDVRTSFHRFYMARTARYRAIADVTVDIQPSTPEATRDDILRVLS